MSVRRFATALSVAVVGGAVLTPSSAASAQVDPDFELMAIVADGEVTADGDLTTVDDNSWASYRYTVFHDGRRVGGGSGIHKAGSLDGWGSKFTVRYRPGSRESVEGRWSFTVTVTTPAHNDCGVSGCVWEPAATRTRTASTVVGRQRANPVLLFNQTNRRLLCLSNRTGESREPTLTLQRRTKDRPARRTTKIRKCVLYTGLRVRKTPGWQQFRLRATGPDFRSAEFSAKVKVKSPRN